MGSLNAETLPLFIISADPEKRKFYHEQVLACQASFPSIIEVGNVDDAICAIRQIESSCCIIDYASVSADDLFALKNLRDEYTIENLPILGKRKAVQGAQRLMLLGLVMHGHASTQNQH